MNQALINLLVFSSIVILGALAYRLLIAKNLLQSVGTRQKTLIEDILKQLYHVEQSKSAANLVNLAGALQLKRKTVLKTVEQMSQTGLLNLNDTEIALTEDGRQYALKMVRIHRLYEKYLAERTGHQPSDWHNLAEKKEHELTEEQTAELQSFLGNPLFDPHGDPIPTQTGEISAVTWTPLPSFEVNKACKIAHIEDEPEVIYKQILDKRLFIGSHVLLDKMSNNEVIFTCEGVNHKLSNIVAANIHVEELNKNEVFERNATRLSTLTFGEHAEIIGLSKECRGANRRRLLDLGILPGTKIEVDLQSPLSDPVAYRVRNTSIALRSTLADLILINKK